uniref:Endonuclease/exonuclease/phosphatase domain-containing protein n=1 Tax=Cannabis sativa TaxID=3483 RepID=A0A803NJ54_CANSA
MYGPPYAIMKKDFWDWLLQKVQLCSDAWAVMGDLNVIMDENEKLGGRPYQLREGNILKEFILNTGGVDLGFEGAPCPWQNTRSYSHHIRKQLDRAIADDQWCVSFPRVTVVHLPIYGSDHAPILLKVVGDNEKLLYPFQFLEVWSTSMECGDIISRAWNSEATGSEGTILCKKLKYTKK